MNSLKGICGVYTLTHLPTGKFYIGSTNNLFLRRKSHLDLIKRGVHYNLNIKELSTTPSEFEFKPTPTINIEIARDAEQDLLDEFHGDCMCLNKGDSSRAAWKFLPDDHKLKMTEGRLRSELWRKASAEALASARRGMLGRTHSDETKAKMSAVRKLQGNGLEGKVLSEEHKANLGAAIKASKDKPGAAERYEAGFAKRRRPVSIDGVVYTCVRDAAEKLGLEHGCVAFRLSSSNPLFAAWFKVETEKEPKDVCY